MQKYYVQVHGADEVNHPVTRWYSDQDCKNQHRIDGPAIEWADGDTMWYLNGELHRDGGPAVDIANSVKEWYTNGKRHRIDGPAIEWASGSKRWYLDSEQVSEEEHARLTAPVQEMTVAQIEAALGKKIKIVK